MVDSKDIRVWDKIAESFDETRRKPWKECIDFIKKLPFKSIVLDLGCGNGRHLVYCSERCLKAIGVDASVNQLRIAWEKTRGKENVELIHADAISLPFKDNSIDHILFIATLHNIRGRENRIRALLEIKRVLKPNGTALISVWSKWQKKFLSKLIKKKLSQKVEFGDIEITWKKDGLNIPRFYHLYSKREFKSDIKRAGLSVKKLYSTKKLNHFALVEKIN